MKIGILGGTFDPVHNGHLALANAARDQYGLDRVLFMPAFVPPHKGDRVNLQDARHRYRMVELAIEGLRGFAVSALELERGRVSYTIDTLRELHARYPGDEIYLILGADTLKDTPNWHEADRLKQYAHFLVAPRRGVSKAEVYPLGGQWISMEEMPVSSSDIRDTIAGDGDVSDRLPPKVAAYIRDMNLYRG